MTLYTRKTLIYDTPVVYTMEGGGYNVVFLCRLARARKTRRRLLLMLLRAVSSLTVGPTLARCVSTKHSVGGEYPTWPLRRSNVARGSAAIPKQHTHLCYRNYVHDSRGCFSTPSRTQDDKEKKFTHNFITLLKIY